MQNDFSPLAISTMGQTATAAVSLEEVLLLTATIGAGLTAGLCFAFATFLMSAFDRLGAASAIRAMQAVNATILRSAAMAVWFGAAIVGVAASVFTDQRTLVIAATVLYAIGAIAITGGGNVPLNEQLDRVDPEAADAAEVWRSYRVRWGRWNAVRTAVLILATAGFAWAL